MGIVSWIAAGALAWIIALFLPARTTKRHAITELSLAVVVALAAGVAATALDFGGWRELEPRAIAFSFTTALLSIAVSRRRTH